MEAGRETGERRFVHEPDHVGTLSQKVSPGCTASLAVPLLDLLPEGTFDSGSVSFNPIPSQSK
jgi:hypothetical protein